MFMCVQGGFCVVCILQLVLMSRLTKLRDVRYLKKGFFKSNQDEKYQVNFQKREMSKRVKTSSHRYHYKIIDYISSHEIDLTNISHF
jgi:hypothetical protein